MIDYPECDKLNALREPAHVLSEFLEFLGQDGLRLCRLEDTGRIRWDAPVEEYFGTHESSQDLIYRFLGIDSNKLELERRAMLAVLQQHSAEL